VSSILFALGQILLGGAFIIHAIRNLRNNVARLSGLLAERRIADGERLVRIGIALQFAGGVLTVLGIFSPGLGLLGGVAMIVFLVIATLLFHPPWAFPAADRGPHIYASVMNAGICGAFLLIIAHGL